MVPDSCYHPARHPAQRQRSTVTQAHEEKRHAAHFTVSGLHPETNLYGWQDIKIELLINVTSAQASRRYFVQLTVSGLKRLQETDVFAVNAPPFWFFFYSLNTGINANLLKLALSLRSERERERERERESIHLCMCVFMFKQEGKCIHVHVWQRGAKSHLHHTNHPSKQCLHLME